MTLLLACTQEYLATPETWYLKLTHIKYDIRAIPTKLDHHQAGPSLSFLRLVAVMSNSTVRSFVQKAKIEENKKTLVCHRTSALYGGCCLNS